MICFQVVTRVTLGTVVSCSVPIQPKMLLCVWGQKLDPNPPRWLNSQTVINLCWLIPFHPHQPVKKNPETATEPTSWGLVQSEIVALSLSVCVFFLILCSIIDEGPAVGCIPHHSCTASKSGWIISALEKQSGAAADLCLHDEGEKKKNQDLEAGTKQGL